MTGTNNGTLDTGTHYSEDGMTYKPAVSVVVPIFNAQKHLNQCISSILGQQFDNLELILVDDGSTDSSGTLCDHWAAKDNRVHVIHKPNGGVSQARNSGLDISQGTFICFVDSDDWLDSSAIGIALEQANTGGTDLVAFGYRSHFDNSIYPDRQPENHCIDATTCFSNSKGNAVQYQNDIAQIDNKLYLFQCWGKLFRRSWIGDHRFNTHVSYGEDTAFVFQLLQQPNSTVCALNDALYNYREQNSGLAGGFSLQKPADILWQHSERLKFYDLNRLNAQYRDVLLSRLCSDVLWALLAMKQPNLQTSIMQKMAYIRGLADSPLRGYYLQGLHHAWSTRGIKILFRINSTILWYLYILI
ncbi:glycosyltransferase family 2 protein [Bifidobacterium reuteri]|nr:glycosyltransferase [Bifidobacterium reuteri]